MRNAEKIGIKRLFAGAVCLTVLAALLFSAFFIAMEAGHDCTGGDCPICELILLCESTLRKLGGAAVLTAFAVLFIITLFTAFLPVFTVCSGTLFSRKVRLNN